MSDFRSLGAQLTRLEDTLRTEVAHLAHLLSAFPQDRDAAEVNSAWSAIATTHRALAALLKEGGAAIRAPHQDAMQSRKAAVLKKRILSARKMIRHFPRVKAAVKAQINPTVTGFDTDSLIKKEKLEVLDHVMLTFFDGMHRLANPNAHTQSAAAEDRACHLDIPLGMARFSRLISAGRRLCLAQRKPAPLRFLDVGSGGGTKLLAASTCFDFCLGLEYEESTVATGMALLDALAADTCHIEHGDALTFQDYGAHDVIYFYRPLVGDQNLLKMEAHIFAQLSAGTILLVPHGLITPDLGAVGIRKIDEDLYVAGMSATEAMTLRDTAERLGTQVPADAVTEWQANSYWRPLREVSARNGYNV